MRLAYLAKFLLISILISCSAPKNYTWKGKMVTEKKFDRVAKRFTKKFIKEQSVEDNLLMLGVDVRFDTLGLKSDTTLKTDTTTTIKR